jgi:glycosyltransferase involved in cell wall biosynthesis
MISIITPSLNRASMIVEAIDSVLAQDYPQVEHIIMDGGSTDGTLEVLAKYPHLRVVSEPDRGMYDAINKGIQLANGEVIGLLNSDDYYTPNVFAGVVDTLYENSTCDALAGKAIWFQETPEGEYQEIRMFPAMTGDRFLYRLTMGNPVINAWFFRRQVFSDIGLFDLRYSIASDREFLIRLALRSKKIVTLDKTLYHYRSHPGSMTINLSDTGEAPYIFETRAIAEDYLSREEIDKNDRKILKEWHSESTADQCAAALRRGALRASIDYSFRGMRYNILWPAKFMNREIPRAVRLFRRNLRGLDHHTNAPTS